ncbi:MAG TPA: hypothetical protein VHY20_11815, partial [Pirellulales bacterium]|nr:hypothetical protein [Pirellulales bacterium]
KGWQDTGVDLIAGKPVMIRSDGKWRLNMHYPVGGDGLEIPEELRKFNLGSLIGIVVPPGESPSSKPQAPKESTAASEPPADQQAAEGDNANGAAAEGAASDKPAEAAGDAAPEAAKEEEDKTPKPFFIGRQADLFAKTSGRLYLRMYDADAADNVGKIRVDINGTFGSTAADSASASRTK